jgi:hypothetical protein
MPNVYDNLQQGRVKKNIGRSPNGKYRAYGGFLTGFHASTMPDANHTTIKRIYLGSDVVRSTTKGIRFAILKLFDCGS